MVLNLKYTKVLTGKLKKRHRFIKKLIAEETFDCLKKNLLPNVEKKTRDNGLRNTKRDRWEMAVRMAESDGKRKYKKLSRKYRRFQKRGTENIHRRNSLFVNKLKYMMTPSEKKMGYLLKDMGVYFIFQKGFITPFHRIFDFYLPDRKVAIEVDGKYHEEIAQKDANKDRWYLQSRGIRTLRILNEEMDTPDLVKQKIQSFF